MLRAYKYKIKPTREQQEKLNTSLGASRFIYNYALSRRINEYKENKSFLSDKQLYQEINKMRSVVNLDDDMRDYSWMMDIPGQVIINTIRNQSVAFKNMTKHGFGFPKFKKKNRCRDSFCLFNPQNSLIDINFLKHEIRLSKLGWIRFRPNEEFNTDNHEIRNVTVSKTRDTYWISVLVENHQPLPPKAKVKDDDSSVGIDLGLMEFATLSTGEKIDNPRFLEISLKRMRMLNKKMSRQQKGSKRREQTIMKISRLHEKTANRRIDFLHKLSCDLVKRYDTICIEDLDVRGMIQHGHLSRSISSVGWSMFTSMLSYKADWKGKNLLKVNRFYTSSKTCNVCGAVNKSLTLADRSWICTSCLETHDRDINASINIRDKAIYDYHKKNKQSVGTPDLTGMEMEDTTSMKCSCMLDNDVIVIDGVG